MEAGPAEDHDVVSENFRTLQERAKRNAIDTVLHICKPKAAPVPARTVEQTPLLWTPLPISGQHKQDIIAPKIVAVTTHDNRVLIGRQWAKLGKWPKEPHVLDKLWDDYVHIQPALTDHAVRLPAANVDTTVERKALKIPFGATLQEHKKGYMALSLAMWSKDTLALILAVAAISHTAAVALLTEHNWTYEEEEKALNHAGLFTHFAALGAVLTDVKYYSLTFGSAIRTAQQKTAAMNMLLYALRAESAQTNPTIAAFQDRNMRWHVVKADSLADMREINSGVPTVRAQVLPAASAEYATEPVRKRPRANLKTKATLSANPKQIVEFRSLHPHLTAEPYLGITVFAQDSKHNIEAMSVPPIDYKADALAMAYSQGILLADGSVTDPSSLLSIYSKSFLMLHTTMPVEFGRIVDKRMKLLETRGQKADPQFMHAWLYNVVGGEVWSNTGKWSTGSFHLRRNAYNSIGLASVQQGMLDAYYHALQPLRDAGEIIQHQLQREYLHYQSRLGFVVMPRGQYLGMDVLNAEVVFEGITMCPDDMFRLDLAQELA